jgi:hypothetical protein
MRLIGGFIIVGVESLISHRRLVDIVLIIRTLLGAEGARRSIGPDIN